jgi:hypothetical protein
MRFISGCDVPGALDNFTCKLFSFNLGTNAFSVADHITTPQVVKSAKSMMGKTGLRTLLENNATYPLRIQRAVVGSRHSDLSLVNSSTLNTGVTVTATAMDAATAVK